jgi:formate hydrogenlyase subunit 6/NADH:ubiquinone oxidoreductase subunit I
MSGTGSCLPVSPAGDCTFSQKGISSPFARLKPAMMSRHFIHTSNIFLLNIYALFHDNALHTVRIKSYSREVAMAHTITELCIGCDACKRNCPVFAVEGELKKQHSIMAGKCVDCGVCGMGCPKGAIKDASGATVARIKQREREKPEINRNLCTGCSICADICRAGALALSAPEKRGDTATYMAANNDKCVGCSLCAKNCPPQAITMRKPAVAAAV